MINKEQYNVTQINPCVTFWTSRNALDIYSLVGHIALILSRKCIAKYVSGDIHILYFKRNINIILEIISK